MVAYATMPSILCWDGSHSLPELASNSSHPDLHLLNS
jgi:hypothetical protein